MDDVNWALWVAFVTGAITPALVEFIRAYAERRMRRLDRRTEFQFETLRELQAALLDFGVITARVHVRQEVGQPISDELWEERRAVSSRASMLASCVRDDKIRKETEAFSKFAYELLGISLDPETHSEKYKMVERLDKPVTRIGERLRSL